MTGGSVDIVGTTRPGCYGQHGANCGAAEGVPVGQSVGQSQQGQSIAAFAESPGAIGRGRGRLLRRRPFGLFNDPGKETGAFAGAYLTAQELEAFGVGQQSWVDRGVRREHGAERVGWGVQLGTGRCGQDKR